jgi:hypothetical protein
MLLLMPGLADIAVASVEHSTWHATLGFVLLDQQGISALPLFTLMMVGFSMLLHLRPNLNPATAKPDNTTAQSTRVAVDTRSPAQPLPSVSVQPASSQPASSPPVAVQPASSQPVAAQPASSQPVSQATAPSSGADLYRVACQGFSGLNLRTAPNGSVVQLLPCTTVNVQITGSATVLNGVTWVPVAVQGATGWVAQDYLVK